MANTVFIERSSWTKNRPYSFADVKLLNEEIDKIEEELKNNGKYTTTI